MAAEPVRFNGTIQPRLSPRNSENLTYDECVTLAERCAADGRQSSEWSTSCVIAAVAYATLAVAKATEDAGR